MKFVGRHLQLNIGATVLALSMIPTTLPAAWFVRGDVNASGAINVADAVVVLEYLFRGKTGPACLDRLDANDDGGVDIVDPVAILLWLFAQGSPPRPPFPAAGTDPTA